MMNTINIQSVRKVNLIVGGCHAGTIDFESSSPPLGDGNILDQNFLKNNSNDLLLLQSDDNDDDDEDDAIQSELEGWSERNDEILRAAVKTLGVGESSWKRISEHWFHGSKFDFECQHRWESVLSSTPCGESKNKQSCNNDENTKNSSLSTSMPVAKSIPIPHQSSANSFIPNQYDNGKQKQITKLSNKRDPRKNKAMPLRKRRELEAVEERRLFGKEKRPEVENQLIHRAFIAGQNKMEQIMKMNAAETKEEYGTTVSFASVVTEMQNVKSSEVESSIKSNSKSVRKLPRSVMEIEERELISPIRRERSKQSSQGGDLLNFASSQLPIEQVLEAERIRTAKIARDEKKGNMDDIQDYISDHEDDGISLTVFLSPPLKNPFPCLGIPDPVMSRYDPPKPMILFRPNQS